MGAIKVFVAAVLEHRGSELQDCHNILHRKGLYGVRIGRYIELHVWPRLKALLKIVVQVIEQRHPVMKVALLKIATCSV